MYLGILKVDAIKQVEMKSKDKKKKKKKNPKKNFSNPNSEAEI